MKLNLGCGPNYWEGWTNIDSSPQYKTDIVYDLDNLPYPFKENEVDEVYMEHTLEHLEKPDKVIEELWRIVKPKGRLIISVPHWSHFTAYSLVHKTYFSGVSLQPYDNTEGTFKSDKARFKIKCRYTATRIYFRWLNMLNPLLNINLLITEGVLCKFLPVSQVIFDMEVIKDG